MDLSKTAISERSRSLPRPRKRVDKRRRSSSVGFGNFLHLKLSIAIRNPRTGEPIQIKASRPGRNSALGKSLTGQVSRKKEAGNYLTVNRGPWATSPAFVVYGTFSVIDAE